MRRIVVMAASTAVVFLALGCDPGANADKVEFKVPVSVQEVGSGEVEDHISVTGSLRSSETVSLAVEARGVLTIARASNGRRLGEGDRVRAGQLIAEITGEDVRVAARTEATRRRYEAAASDHEAAKKLFDEGLNTETNLRQAETAVEDARLEYDRCRLVEVRNRLITPIDGVLMSLARDAQGRPMANGQLVSPGFVVAQVAPTGDLVADVDVVGTDVARVREGQSARIFNHAFAGESFDGEVIRLAPSIDVPREAIAERGGKNVVFVLVSQRVAKRDVELGLGDDETVEVRSGLEQGERIVVRGLETLADGSRVRVTGTS